MKIPHLKITRLIMPFIAFFLLFACSKDTDLLADYVVADVQEAKFLSGFVLNDYYVSTTSTPMILDVLANDEFTNLDNVKIVDVSNPSNGIVVINEDNTITYTPGASPTETPTEPLEDDSQENQASQDDQTGDEVESGQENTTGEEDQINEGAENGQEPKVGENNQPKTEEQSEDNPEAEQDNTPTEQTETESKEETTDTFTYTTETTNEDDTTTTNTGTVTVTTNKDYGILKAFPTAYGAGSSATGGRGGTVYHVTNLNNSGPGSFRDAVSRSNRIIVFDVSGTIELKGNLKTSSDNLTIAGQTAPEGGITLTGDLLLLDRCDNIIMRYIRFKPRYIPEYISPGNNRNTGYDALNIANITNSIFDHVSVAWGGDEAVSITGESDNVTFQNSLVIDSHKGMILGDSNASVESSLSLLNNVFVNAGYRFPNVCATNSESINNVVHNWDRNLNVFPCRQGGAQFNEINNYYQRGQKTTNVLSASRHGGHWLDLRFELDARAYTSGNVINGVLSAGDDNWKMYRMRFDVKSGPYAGLKQWDPAPRDFQVKTPFKLLGDAVPIKSASEALQEGGRYAGCSKRLNGDGSTAPNFDSLDERFLEYVRKNTYVAHTEADDVVNQGYYKEYQRSISSSPISRRSGDFDSDGDGMPDTWEDMVGHDPNKKDHNEDPDNNGYTNLEEYLNLVDF